MSRWRWHLSKLAVVASIIAVVAVVVALKFGDETTTQSLSPNEEYRVSLVEKSPAFPLVVDRNFSVRLATLNSDGHRMVADQTLFISPDEGKPVGSERFIWSKDSAYVLLVGRHFFLAEDISVVGGEQAYLLCHLPTKRIWCNSEQTKTRYSALNVAKLREIEFTLPVLTPEEAN